MEYHLFIMLFNLIFKLDGPDLVTWIECWERQGGIRCVEWSAGGDLLATADTDRCVSVFRHAKLLGPPPAWELLGRYRAHTAQVPTQHLSLTVCHSCRCVNCCSGSTPTPGRRSSSRLVATV